MEYQPLGDRILVKAKEPETETDGGIILPEAALEREAIGEVVAVGPGIRYPDGALLPVSLNVGCEVMYNRFGGSDVKIDGDDLLVLRESDVLLVRVK